tara:strand:- start:1679 stop:1837 length:159 start_codon:yes stop_codon:yes gene_type:complete
MKKFWSLWALSLGENVEEADSDAHKVAVIKTTIVVINLICCFCIILKTFSFI